MLNCPHCKVSEINIHTINCPACGGRVRCPECGSLLKYDESMEGYARCSACDFRMPSAKKDPIQEKAKAVAKVAAAYGLESDDLKLPKEVLTDWDLDRWMMANHLLFSQDDDRAMLLFIVTKDDVHQYSAKHPDFKHSIRTHLDSTLKNLREDLLG